MLSVKQERPIYWSSKALEQMITLQELPQKIILKFFYLNSVVHCLRFTDNPLSGVQTVTNRDNHQTYTIIRERP